MNINTISNSAIIKNTYYPKAELSNAHKIKGVETNTQFSSKGLPTLGTILGGLAILLNMNLNAQTDFTPKIDSTIHLINELPQPPVPYAPYKIELLMESAQ